MKLRIADRAYVGDRHLINYHDSLKKIVKWGRVYDIRLSRTTRLWTYSHSHLRRRWFCPNSSISRSAVNPWQNRIQYLIWARSRSRGTRATLAENKLKQFSCLRTMEHEQTSSNYDLVVQANNIKSRRNLLTYSLTTLWEYKVIPLSVARGQKDLFHHMTVTRRNTYKIIFH